MQGGNNIGNLQSRLKSLVLPAASVAIIDQAAKYLVRTNIGSYEVVDIIDGLFRLVFTKNTGVAFGFLNAFKPGIVNPALTVVNLLAMALITYLALRGDTTQLGRFSFGLVLGGAAGNLIDRVIQGYVVDFLDLYIGKYHWPAFNVADAAITVGVILLLADSILMGRKSRSGQG